MLGRVRITDSNLNFILTNVYRPTQNSQKLTLRLELELSNHLNSHKLENHIIGGDFNAILNLNEKFGDMLPYHSRKNILVNG